MTRYTDLEYLKLSRILKILYKLKLFFYAIPLWFVGVGKAIGKFFKKLVFGIGHEFKDIGLTFVHGDWKTKVSYFIFGFGSLMRKQWIRGILFLLMEIVFIWYMINSGGYWLSMLGSLGKVAREDVQDKYGYVTAPYDDSFKILLYSILTIAWMVALIWTWRFNIKQNKLAEDLLKQGKRLRTGKEDMRSLLDDQFHKTMLALPLLGIVVFTVLPIVFMIIVAFTNYGVKHDPANGQLFQWVGWDNFNMLFSWKATGKGNSFAATFGEILGWTLIWAFFATFLNYIIGTLVAIMINKKGIKFKKLWRSVLVLTIAIPQFISLLYVSKMFSDSSYVIGLLKRWGWVGAKFTFWDNKYWARAMVIIINLWIGIPYLMLIVSGVLMNVPADLYESAKIDGASGVKQFTKITLPYLLFVTGPYLLTSFTGNINNFNVIYLLTGGGPTDPALRVTVAVYVGKKKFSAPVAAGNTDLLITWLFKITTENAGGKLYNLAAVISILLFIVISVISLIIYNILPSNRSEEDYA